MEMLIPFAGFYESLHDAELDHAAEQMCTNPSCDVNQDALAFLNEKCQWKTIHRAYAKEYAEQLAHKFDMNWVFKDLISPREYNFQTDRIVVEIELIEALKLWNNLDHTELRRIAGEKFTSRSGFSSFYSPDWNSWGSFKEWDHNQLGAVLEAYIATQDEQFEELTVMENARSNGCIDEWILSGLSQEDLAQFNAMGE
jgi:hypothetical protein